MTERKSILIAHTGGTIGMRRSEDGYRPAAGFLAQQTARLPELQAEDMPRFDIEEFDPLLDSSDMGPQDWVRIGRCIADHYASYDGFVVLHGTDTMAYSAAALSFMLERLDKPIILTGSQIPLVELRNDARENLLTSLLFAARHPVPEVCLYFGARLLRGNRSTKINTLGFRAFDSPNYPPLGTAGVDLRIDRDAVRPEAPRGRLRFRQVGGPRVADVRFFPGITAEVIRQFLRPPIQGAVLHTFGAGNAPSSPDIHRVLSEASERGIVLVNCTQCLEGTVRMQAYATGNALRRAGVVSGYDMTPEAALAKLIYLLSLELGPEETRRMMELDLRGELTRPTAR